MHNTRYIIKRFDRVLLIVIALLLCVLSYFRLNSGLMNKLDEVSESSGSVYLYLALIICLLVYAFFHKTKQSTFSFWIPVTYFVLSYLLFVPLSVKGLVGLPIVILWMFCYWFGRRLSSTNKETISFFIRVILLVVVLPLSAYCLFVFFTTDLVLSQHVSDAFFYISVYFPFVLLIEKNRTLKILMISLFTILIVISFKRSIILGFAVCLVAYLLSTDQKKYMSKWYLQVVLIAAVFGGYYIIKDFIGPILERFSALESDHGSGRTIIYSQVLSGISNSDFFHLVFGHGFKSVTSITIDNVMAHNDLLELLYDFGIIGSVIYILFILSLWKNAIRHRKLNKALYSAFLSSFVFFIIISLSNCVIYSSMIISPFMLAFGIYTGLLMSDGNILQVKS